MISDDASSVVKSYLGEDGLWSASIRTTSDLYFVEVHSFAVCINSPLLKYLHYTP